jgi:hypothetical protein
MPQKGSGSGPEAAVRLETEGQALAWQLELPTVLQRETGDYHPVGESAIDAAIQTWFKVYHSLVWLVAATDLPKRNPVNRDFIGTIDCPAGEGACLEDSHRVPAFYFAETGTGSRSGWIYEEAKTRFEELRQSKTFGKRFLKEIKQQTSINDDLQQPLLQHFLAKFKNLPADFDQDECLADCRASISGMHFHDHSRRFVEEALSLIEKLWQEHLQNPLEEMRGWLEAANPEEPAGSEAWLEKKLQLSSSLEDSITELFDGDNDEAKLKISRETSILQVNMTTFELIFHRFADKDSDETSKGLEKAVGNLSGQAHWQNLLRATYGAIAWQIFQQAKGAMKNVRQIL